MLHTHTHPFNSPFSGTTQVSQYQIDKTNLDLTEARDSEWQWHQLGRMQICTSLQTDNHANTSPLSFLQAGCPSYRPTNSVKALKDTSSLRATYTTKLGWDTSDHRVGHLGPYGGTVWTIGLDSSVLRSEVSFGHFGTGAEMSGHFRPT